MKLNDIGIEYEVYGPRTGLPIVFIHGFPFNQTMWKQQVEALKGEYYVITYDVRGHGKSDIGDGHYTIELFVDDFIKLLDYLKVQSAVIVGLSMGGYIALRSFERHPERFRALILCDTRSEVDNNDGKIKRANQIKAIKSNGMKDFIESFVPAVLFEKTLKSNERLVNSVREMIEETSPLAAAGTLLALAARTDTTHSLFNINIPTLILVGKYDSITPPSTAHAMKSKIPDAELHVIPEAGHLSNLENPQEFNKHLLAFLKKLSPR